MKVKSVLNSSRVKSESIISWQKCTFKSKYCKLVQQEIIYAKSSFSNALQNHVRLVNN